MALFGVFSINSRTHSPEFVPAATLEEARALQSRALGEGRLLVEVIDSDDKREQWRRLASELVNTRLSGGDGTFAFYTLNNAAPLHPKPHTANQISRTGQSMAGNVLGQRGVPGWHVYYLG